MRGVPDVLLGLLGREVYEMQTACLTVLPIFRPTLDALSWADALGCPTATDYIAAHPAARQVFQHGEMLWVDWGSGKQYIYAIISNPDYPPVPYYRMVADSWREGEPERAGLTPPAPGLSEPERGFGAVWRTHDDIRTAIGWAIEPEQQETADTQVFPHGVMVA